MAWLSFLIPCGVLVASLSYSQGFWDTGEIQVVPYILGISHSTGFPLFVLTASALAHALPLGTVAWRVALLSAVCTAGAACALYWFVRELRGSPPVALLAAWTFVALGMVWARGSRAEVLDMSLLFNALALLFAVRWYRRAAESDFYRTLLCIGCSAATHPLVILLVPTLGYALLMRVERLRAPMVVWGTLLALLPLATYAYIPVRSAALAAQHADPTLALGVPPGRPFWNYNDPSTPAKFVAYLGDGGGNVSGSMNNIFSLDSYGNVATTFAGIVADQMPALAVLAALCGAVALVRADRWLAAALAAAAFIPVVFAIDYPESDALRYMLITFWLVAAAIALGAQAAFAWFFAGTDSRVWPQLGAVALLGTLWWSLFAHNTPYFGQRDDTRGSHFAQSVAAETPDDAVLVVDWTRASALAYAAYVDKNFGRRIVVVASPYQFSDRYAAWLQAGRHVFYIFGGGEYDYPAPLVSQIVDPVTGVYALSLAKP